MIDPNLVWMNSEHHELAVRSLYNLWPFDTRTALHMKTSAENQGLQDLESHARP